jgi:hypothetical protein
MFTATTGSAMNDAETRSLRESLHDLNNSLNVISMQTELAQMYADTGDIELLQSALGIIMKECRNCSSISHGLQSDFPKISS